MIHLPKSLQSAVLTFLAAVQAFVGADAASPESGAPVPVAPVRGRVAATLTEGIFELRTFEPDAMSPGYTMVWPFHGHTAYWLKGPDVVYVLDLPGRIKVLRQDEDGVYGIIEHKVCAYNWDGSLRYAIAKGAHHDCVLTILRATLYTGAGGMS